MAWKASSTSRRSCSDRRQTPSTIGPCRVTRASNAPSSPAANRRRSWPSDRPVSDPWLKICSMPRRTAPWFSIAIVVAPIWCSSASHIYTAPRAGNSTVFLASLKGFGVWGRGAAAVKFVARIGFVVVC